MVQVRVTVQTAVVLVPKNSHVLIEVFGASDMVEVVVNIVHLKRRLKGYSDWRRYDVC